MAATTADAATFTVSNTNDDGPGSLRYSVNQVDLTYEEDTIVFDAQVFNSPKSITLTSGQISFTHSHTINGPGANLLTISGNNRSRIFFSNSGNGEFIVNNLTLTEGLAPNGGAIRSGISLKLSNMVITGNRAMGLEDDTYTSLGGGIYARGGLVITDSTISNNSAIGILVIQTNPNSTFGDYGTSGGGGGIYSGGFTPVIVNCTFANNTARGADSPAAGGNKAGS